MDAAAPPRPWTAWPFAVRSASRTEREVRWEAYPSTVIPFCASRTDTFDRSAIPFEATRMPLQTKGGGPVLFAANRIVPFEDPVANRYPWTRISYCPSARTVTPAWIVGTEPGSARASRAPRWGLPAAVHVSAPMTWPPTGVDAAAGPGPERGPANGAKSRGGD